MMAGEKLLEAFAYVDPELVQEPELVLTHSSLQTTMHRISRTGTTSRRLKMTILLWLRNRLKERTDRLAEQRKERIWKSLARMTFLLRTQCLQSRTVCCISLSCFWRQWCS